MKAEEIKIRDPYVLPYEGKYYIYGTRSETCWGEAEGFDCYVSEDLKDFEGPIEIFHRSEDFFATRNFWAPECYEHEGSFYLLTTFGGQNIKKGIYLLRAESPTGPFELYGQRLTPEDWTCIDGTLYFEDEHIYLIYSHSFEDHPDADICYQEVSKDLKETITEPKPLFSPKEASWARPVPFAEQEFGMKGEVYFSDGPCVFRGEQGDLFMTWSSWSQENYAVGVAVSDSGTIAGPWRQMEKPFWPRNGGHGMVFQTFEGKRYFCLHYPNDIGKEHPNFFGMKEQDGTLLCQGNMEDL